MDKLIKVELTQDEVIDVEQVLYRELDRYRDELISYSDNTEVTQLINKQIENVRSVLKKIH